MTQSPPWRLQVPPRLHYGQSYWGWGWDGGDWDFQSQWPWWWITPFDWVGRPGSVPFRYTAFQPDISGWTLNRFQVQTRRWATNRGVPQNAAAFSLNSGTGFNANVSQADPASAGRHHADNRLANRLGPAACAWAKSHSGAPAAVSSPGNFPGYPALQRPHRVL